MTICQVVSIDTGTWRTDRQTDRIAVSISRVRIKSFIHLLKLYKIADKTLLSKSIKIYLFIYLYFVHIVFILFLCFDQSRLEAYVFYTPFVLPSDRSRVTKLVNPIFFLTRVNQFWCKLAQVVHEAKGFNGQLWGSGGQRSWWQDTEIGHDSPLSEIISRTMQRFSAKSGRHILR